MFDVVAQLINGDKLVGYELTDRIEKIQLNLNEFKELVKGNTVYHVRYMNLENEVKGILGLNLDKLDKKQIDLEDNKEIICINHKVVRYKTCKVIEMLKHTFLDYVQIKYFTNEFVQIQNKRMKKSIRALEVLTDKYNDEKCIDIKPFLDRYKSKYDILGYNITNTSNQVIKFRANGAKKYRTLKPNSKTYVNISEMHNLCKSYTIDQSKLTNRSKEVYLSVEHSTPNVLIEELDTINRRLIISDKQLSKIKDPIAKEMLRDEDYKEYKLTGKCW